MTWYKLLQQWRMKKKETGKEKNDYITIDIIDISQYTKFYPMFYIYIYIYTYINILFHIRNILWLWQLGPLGFNLTSILRNEEAWGFLMLNTENHIQLTCFGDNSM